MGEKLQLQFKLVTGQIESIEINQSATVLDAKRLLHVKLPSTPPHRQKLIADYRGAGTGTILEDGQVLSSYPNIRNGSVIFLIIQIPWKIYVHDPNSRIYDIEIPSNDPRSYTITDLRALVEKQTCRRLDEYQFQFKGVPIEESRHGKRLTLLDCGIDKEDTVFLMLIGFMLDITQPQVDVCFLVDCTGSMSGWIESVKNNIKNLRDQLQTQYKGCDLKFAFVRYTDYDQPESTRTTKIDFTDSIDQFHQFVNSIGTPHGVGGDEAEDIMGGLKFAFTQLKWRESAAKVLIHIADNPCHGSMYHNGINDNHPGGDKYGITHDQMMKEVVRLEIQYWFGYIKRDNTDKMINVFNDSLKHQSDHRLIIRQFEAVQPEQIGGAVHKSVTASVFAKEAMRKSCSAISAFDTTTPNWTTLSEKQGVKTPPPGPKSLQNLQDGLKLDRPSVPIAIKVAPNPFTDGEESYIYRGYDTRNKRQVVLKKFKASGATLECHMKVLEIQTIASTYARDFNNDKKKPRHVESIEFIPADVIQFNDGSLYILQAFIDGKFEKYNTNNGIVCTAATNSDMMQAFSHFTYVHSGESLLICDLQGVRNSHGVNQLSDPAIHCRIRQRTYGNTDSGFLGIRRFFNSHNCNNICRSMGLDGVRA